MRKAWGIGGVAAAGALGLWGVAVFSSGCGQQNLQGCSAPASKPSPPAATFGQGNASNQQIPRNQRITVAFNEPMQAGTLTATTFVLLKCDVQQTCNQPVSSKITYDDCTATATLTPDAVLEAGTTYEATLAACNSSQSDQTCTGQTLPRDSDGQPLISGGGGGTCPSSMASCFASFPFTTQT